MTLRNLSRSFLPFIRMPHNEYYSVASEEAGMKPCKFALKVWNAQQAGAIGVRHLTLDPRELKIQDHAHQLHPPTNIESKTIASIA